MKNYVIKNCPAVYRNGNAPLVCCDKSYRCDMIEDCLIKKIIKVCKAVESHNVKCSGTKLAQRILARFDIEGVL